MVDLLVIGAGLSGLMAAYTAVQSGLTVRVVAKGLGAMHWSAGTIDVLGYDPANPQIVVQRPLDHLPKFIKNNPEHPYGLLDSERVTAVLADFLALSETIGLPYVGAAEVGNNLLLPSPAGAARPAYLAPKGQAAGDLEQPEPMLIIGFEGMRDFYPTLIADNLTRLGYQARIAKLPLDLITDRRDSNNVQLAQALDDPAQREKLANGVREQIKDGERVGLPAILGLNEHSHVFADLQDLVGSRLFEIPTLPPSVPGARLFKAVREQLLSLGVRVEAGMEVIKSQAQNGAVEWVATETSSRPLKHQARQFLLATGGILGGGFNSGMDGRVWEPIFNLPLTVPQSRPDWFRASFLDPAGQPVFHGGIKVNEKWQPVNGDGQPIYGNLRAVGGDLAGYDRLQERSLEGTAVVSGVAAAKSLVEVN